MDAQIVHALEAAGRLTTRELAAVLRADRASVYRRCKRLEGEGRLTSELIRAGGKTIYFFPMTKEIVTSESHERIERLNDAIAETVRAYLVPQQRSQLLDALEVQFERAAGEMADSRQAALEEFAGELLRVAATARKRGDVMSHLGIRPMHPPTRVWALGRQLSLA